MSHRSGWYLQRIRAVIAAIAQTRSGSMTCAEIAEAIDEEERSVRKSLQAYMRMGWVKRGPERVRAGQNLGRRVLETWMVGDTPVPEIPPRPAALKGAPAPKRSPSGSIEQQHVLFVPAPQHDGGIVARALATRLPIEVAVQRWRCAA